VFDGSDDLLGRAVRLTGLLDALDAETAGGVADAYEENLARVSEFEVRFLMAAWCRFDPEAALRRALTWPEGPKRAIAVEEVARSWALREPRAAQEAMAIVPGIRKGVGPGGELQDAFRRGLADGWIMNGDIEGATEALLELPRGFEQGRAARKLAEELLRRAGPEAVERWAEGVPDDAPGDFKYLAFRRAALILLDYDFERGKRWLERNADTKFGQTGMKVLAREWGEQDPEAALAWLRSQPEGRAQQTAVLIAFERWIASDVDAARAWLEREPESERLDAMAAALARKLVSSDPEAAVAWAQRIGDERFRTDTLVAVGRTWYRNDRASAAKWLETSGLPESAQAEVKSAVRRRPPRGTVNTELGEGAADEPAGAPRGP
jgi:hypothetical protein